MPQRVFLEAGLNDAEYRLAMQMIGKACELLPDQSALSIAAYLARLIKAGVTDPNKLLSETYDKLKIASQSGPAPC